MKAETKTLQTSDQTELFVKDWLLKDEAEKRGAVLIVHGLGEHCERYARLAEFLNENGFDVRGYDQRGHGKSSGNRGEIPSENALLEDAKFVYDDYAQNQIEKPFLVGHSMGGAVAVRAAVDKYITPRGLILSSPAITAKLSLSEKMQLKLGRLTPNIAVSNGLKVEYISHDKQIVEDYKNDELVHDKITPRLANFIIDSGQETLKRAANFHISTLLLIAGNDHLVDANGAKQLFAKLPKDNATIHVYENLYHEIFNETEIERAKVFADLKDWLCRNSER
jgi:alpha-beta hydrolase superfamily lysophospholipase